MKQCLFILMLFVVIFNLANGQLTTKQGDTVEYTIILDKQIDSNIRFDLNMDNPTLLYIDSIKINGIKLQIQRKNYILYCSCDEIKTENIELTLFGTALFGNDTLTYIRFNDVKIDENEIDLEPIEVIVEQQYNHFYSRFSKITKAYPMPASKWNGFTLEYEIDIDCDVIIRIVNERVDCIWDMNEYKQKGKHTIEMNIADFAAGVYYVFLNTKAGNDTHSFIIGNP